jgi:hypothetical protein
MNTLNYKKNNNIYNINNYINKPKTQDKGPKVHGSGQRTQEDWVSTQDPGDLGLDAWPNSIGSRRRT